MPTIRGRLLDTNGEGQSGLLAELRQGHPMYGGVRIARDTTDANGNFAVSYSLAALQYGGLFHIRFRNGFGRVIFRSNEESLLGVDVVLPDFVLAPVSFEGFLITEFDPGGTHPRLSTGNTLAFFVDDHLAWAQVAAAIKAAKKELNIQLFWHDVGHDFLVFTPDPPDPLMPKPTAGVRLEVELAEAQRRGVCLRYVIFDDVVNPPISVFDRRDTADEVEAFFKGEFPEQEIVRRFGVDFRAPMHAKFMTFDGQEAHLIGSPFQQDYFDQAPTSPGAPTHLIEDPRRGAGVGKTRRSEVPKSGTVGVPIHDVGMSLKGPSVTHLRDTFFRYWNRPREQTPSIAPPAASDPGEGVQIIRTMPAKRFDDRPDGEAGILEAYLRCFAEAQDYIYIENQYYTEPAITDGLAQSLKTTAGLQVIMLINHTLDIPGYSLWQRQQINKLRALLNNEQRSRLGVFTLWSHEKASPRPRILKNYIHSKVAIADDRWATVGSANLDGASLSLGEFLMPGDNLLTKLDTKLERSTEVNAMVLDGDVAPPLLPSKTTFPADLRKQLWSEHLGLPKNELITAPSPGGWLRLWRERAVAKVASLNQEEPSSCRILEWNPEADPTDYLRALGVKTWFVDVLVYARPFDFKTGKWLQ